MSKEKMMKLPYPIGDRPGLPTYYATKLVSGDVLVEKHSGSNVYSTTYTKDEFIDWANSFCST